MEIERVFHDWHVEKCIGEGAFGKVYKIVREDFGHQYKAALKVIEIPQNRAEIESIRNEGMSEEGVTVYFQSMVQDIVEEFALMSRLKGNSNIVSYEDHAVVEKKDSFGWDIYIRMELLTSLFEYIKEHTLTVRDVIQLGIDICRALEICQKYNIIHRDIKPENIFVSDVGTFKLGDFGIARQLEKTSSGLSKKGTLTYMAPEVYKGQEYNSTVDIYSLGIVLYRFLNNNRSPFMPDASQPIKYSDREKANTLRISGEPLPKPCNAEGRLAEIILKACAYNPKERYESAYEMRKALQSVMYTDEESKYIYPDGDTLKNESLGYILESANKSKTGKDEAVENKKEEMEGTVYLFSSNKQVREAEDGTVIMKTGESEVRSEEETQEGKVAIEQNEEVSESKQEEIEKATLSEAEPESEAIYTISEIIKAEENVKKRNKFIIGGAGVSLGILLIVLLVIMIKPKNADVIGQNPEIQSEVSNEPIVEETTDEPIEKDEEMGEAEIVVLKMPNLEGKLEKDATKAVQEMGLQVKIIKVYSDEVAMGKIISQEPVKETEIDKGNVITLKVSKGAEKVSVPSVKGYALNKAKVLLKKMHLQCKIKQEYSNQVAKGRVIYQSIKAKKKVKKNTTIILTISKGKKVIQPTPTPKVTYKSPTSQNTPTANSNKKSEKQKESKKKNETDDYTEWNLVN